MSETITHVTVYDASDRHSIDFRDDRIYGCGCGFQCPDWDFEGDTLVDHLRELPPRVVYTDLDGPTQDPANNPTCAQADEAADYQINGLQEVLASVEALADEWEQTPRFSYQSISVEHATRLRAVLGSDAQRLTAKDPRCTADELRMDNADLARQLTDASRRRADAFDEGYDKAMSDAHSVLNQRGYLERRGDDNGNPYRALGSDAHTEQKGTGQ